MWFLAIGFCSLRAGSYSTAAAMPISCAASVSHWAQHDMKAVKRIVADQCCGVIIDLQGFFLAQVDKRLRSRIKTNTGNFVRLLNYFQIPIVVTLERPVERQGNPAERNRPDIWATARRLSKKTSSTCKDKKIKGHLAGLKRRQVIVAGCETDVCVLQSCLGLLGLGYEVYRDGGVDIFLRAQRRCGDRAHEGRRRRFHDLQDALLRTDRGGGRRAAHRKEVLRGFRTLPRRPAGFGAR